MLTLQTESMRYTRPYPVDAAVATCGPGREVYIRQIYALVEAAGGTVWDCDLEYGEIHLGVELAGGESHPLWARLKSLCAAVDGCCEVCGRPGVLRADREYWRVLCDQHT